MSSRSCPFACRTAVAGRYQQTVLSFSVLPSVLLSELLSALLSALQAGLQPVERVVRDQAGWYRVAMEMCAGLQCWVLRPVAMVRLVLGSETRCD